MYDLQVQNDTQIFLWVKDHVLMYNNITKRSILCLLKNMLSCTMKKALTQKRQAEVRVVALPMEMH